MPTGKRLLPVFGIDVSNERVPPVIAFDGAVAVGQSSVTLENEFVCFPVVTVRQTGALSNMNVHVIVDGGVATSLGTAQR